jgi:hypothetical protein
MVPLRDELEHSQHGLNKETAARAITVRLASATARRRFRRIDRRGRRLLKKCGDP